MDKFEKILDMIDHQDKYSDEEVHEIFQDEDCRKLYQTMQEVDSALLKQDLGKSLVDGKGPTVVDIDEEWEKFSNEHQFSETIVRQGFSWRKIAASIAGFILVSGIAFAAIHTYIKRSQEPMLVSGDNKTEVVANDSAKQSVAKDSVQLAGKAEKPAVHKTFENVPFGNMIAEIAAYYGRQVKFENADAKNLRLYYEWDSHSSIESIVKELNQFENVNIELVGQIIIVK